MQRKEPHVVDVAQLPEQHGKQTSKEQNRRESDHGVDTLHGTSYVVVPDMIEAGTYMFAAAATKGDVLIKNDSKASGSNNRSSRRLAGT